MPFYEYKAKDNEKSCHACIEIFEVMQSIKSEYLKFCPECGNELLKIISNPGGIVFKYRQMNQYSDSKVSKAWRDKNGNLHKITPADGNLKSPTAPNKITRTPEQIAAIKKKDDEARKKDRLLKGSGRKRIDT